MLLSSLAIILYTLDLGIPKSLLEAAAMGKPIITTNNVGCKEVVDHNFNGYLVEPRSLGSLIDSMIWLKASVSLSTRSMSSL